MAVRRESVRLEADVSDFTTGMARAAAAAGLLRAELDRAGNIRFNTTINNQMGALSRDAERASSSINQLTGRLGAFADAALMLGPGLVPIGAVGVQAIGGLAAAATAAALAGGAAVIAFQGVGDAVKAVDEYQLEPTVENFEKAQVALEALSPAAASFVTEFQKFQPVLTEMRDAAAQGLFPGLTASLASFEEAAPRIERVLRISGRAAGDMAEDFAGALASDKWKPFLKYLRQEVPDAMGALSNIMGDLTHGLAEMFIAADPGNDRMLNWLEDVANGFDNWASSSAGRDDIEDFLEYARVNGPAVAELFSSLVDALAGIVKAAAPLGGPVLKALTAVADVIAAVADSDLGTPILVGVMALRGYARAAAIATAAQARLNASTRAMPPPAAGARPGAPAAVVTRTGSLVGAAGPTVGIVAIAATLNRAASANNDLISSVEAMQDTVNRLDFGNYSTQLDTVGAEFDKLNERLNPTTFGGAMKAAIDPAYYKNQIEGIFGDSDAEEAAAAYEKVADAAYLSSLAVSNLGKEMGLSVGPIDGSARSARELGLIVEQATPAMEQLGITSSQLEFGTTLEQITAAGSEASPMMQLMAQAAIEAGMGASEMNAQIAGVDDTLTGATAKVSAFTRSLANANEFLSGRAGMRDYEASIDAATAALKENGATLDRHTPKGRANAEALDQIAASGLAVADSLKGAERRNFLKGLDKTLIDTARGFGATKPQIDKFLDGLGRIDLDAQRVRGALNSLPKDVRTKILTEGVPKTMGQVDDLVAQYKLTEKERRALIRLMNAEKTKAEARALAAVLDQAARNRESTITITTVNRRRDLGSAGVGPERFNEGAAGAIGAAAGGLVPSTSRTAPNHLTEGIDR